MGTPPGLLCWIRRIQCPGNHWRTNGSTSPSQADWLDGAFSAGDLLMISVLIRLKSSKLLDEYPNLATYVARGETRPAYQRAFDAQLAVFKASQPGG